MDQPHYLSKFTLSDYIAGIVKKETSPPPPSDRDFIRAAKKVERGSGSPKSSSPLSAQADLFQPSRSPSSPLSALANTFQPSRSPSYISVASLTSPSVSYQIPVVSSYLPLSTLRQYFPLATSMHYKTSQQMITLAMSSNYSIMVDGVELSYKKFCIPFQEFDVTYFITEDRDLVVKEPREGELDELVEFMRNIHATMSNSLAEVQRMEELVIQIKMRSNLGLRTMDGSKKKSDMASVEVPNQRYVDVLENVYIVEDIGIPKQEQKQLLEECLGHDEESLIKSALAQDRVGDQDLHVKSDDEKMVHDNHFVDDYGFSDNDDDIEDELTTLISVMNKVKNSDVDETSPPDPDITRSSLQQLDSCSLSSRPRCVKRIHGR